jgi:pyruvate kinase
VRRTKIVATLGPATDSYEKVRDLCRAGMDVARLNFSHGDHETHRRYFSWVRRASEETGRNIAVLQDIQGPKLRVGRFADGAIELDPGDQVTITTDDDSLGDEDLIPIDYPYLTEDLEEGHRVVLADGLLVL